MPAILEFCEEYEDTPVTLIYIGFRGPNPLKDEKHKIMQERFMQKVLPNVLK